MQEGEHQLGATEFKTKYALLDPPNGANAYGKCVSGLAAAQQSRELIH